MLGLVLPPRLTLAAEPIMSSRPLKQLADCTLSHDLSAIVSEDRATTVRMLEHIAEVGPRKLYAPAGYPSMYMYCVHELHMCMHELHMCMTWRTSASRRPTRADSS